MKIMIASDIHGSAYWCRKLLEAREREQPNKLLLLGDILYHGPRNPLPDEYAPAKVAEMLNAIDTDILCVRGNCDSDVDQMVLSFPIMAEYCVIYAGGRMVFATHGHVFNEDTPPKLKKGDILLMFKGRKYYHTAFYMGGGRYADSSKTHKPNIKAGMSLSAKRKSHTKVAIRYKG